MTEFAILATEEGWELRRRGSWPHFWWDVFGRTRYGFERFAGGFWTKRQARLWKNAEMRMYGGMP